MSGNKYILDTNAVIYLLNGDKQFSSMLSTARWIGISIISYVEFLAFENISDNDKSLFDEFLKKINTVNISIENEDIISKIIDIRRKYSLKLPDSIIASTAYVNNAILITWDQKFRQVNELEIYPE